MKAQNILGSPLAIVLGLGLARIIPPRAGDWLARRIAGSMAKRKAELWRILQANLAHVVGPDTSEEKLARMAQQAIYHTGRSYFDVLHYTVEDYVHGRVSMRFDPAEWETALATIRDDRGTILVGPHISNFDLAAQWIAAQGVSLWGLSLPNPDAGTQLVNALRERRGVSLAPLSMRSLRQAVARLRNGGLVMTGVDRPASYDDALLPFFDAPAPMPNGHIRLALQTNARILVACCIREPDGGYRIRFAQPLEIEQRPSRKETIRHNTLCVLAIIEDMIRQAPEQWLMLVPVWPSDHLAR